MNEVLDKFLVRILFTAFICLGLLAYKYAHILFYPSHKKQILTEVHPTQNYVDTLHLFARLIGVAIVFSSLQFNEHHGFAGSIIDFLVLGISAIVTYLLSIYIMDSIVFYNFDYKNEVLKKQNPAYGIVSFFLVIGLATVIRFVFKKSDHSLIILITLWLLGLVLYGFCAKLYNYISNFHFNSMMIQQSKGLAFSYSGYILGSALIITASFNHEHYDIVSYCIQIVLKAILAGLIFPLFKIGITKVFNIRGSEKSPSNMDKLEQLGMGVYEGAVFIMSALLTSIIIGQIHFGTIYPLF